MLDACWQVQADRGFLISPEPLAAVRPVLAAGQPVSVDAITALEALAADLSRLLEHGEVRRALLALPLIDFTGIRGTSPLYDSLIVERLQQIYATFANAYLYAPGEAPVHTLPASLAVPLVQLSAWLDRPPVLAYCNYTLANWQKLDPEGGLDVENLRLVQTFLTLPDESWFSRVHVEVEARSGAALAALLDGINAARNDDGDGLVDAFSRMHASLREMIRAFGKISKGCDPDIYYFKIRPFLFGMADVVFEGVDALRGEPQTLRGASGAQSAVVPALVAGLGIAHERSSLMQHLDVMRAYMPVAHRQFIAVMEASPLRAAVQRQGHGSVAADVYNACLRELMAFRKLHLHYARLFIFQRSQEPPYGTGGTDFMNWLPLLIKETEQHLI